MTISKLLKSLNFIQPNAMNSSINVNFAEKLNQTNNSTAAWPGYGDNGNYYVGGPKSLVPH